MYGYFQLIHSGVISDEAIINQLNWWENQLKSKTKQELQRMIILIILKEGIDKN